MIKTLLKKFNINIKQILSVSDNTLEDIEQEAHIVFIEFEKEINKNEKVFINELKKRCLSFNKYGKRIDSHKEFDRFNQYEENMINQVHTTSYISEDTILGLAIIKDNCSEEEYNLLLDYHRFGQKLTSIKYNIKESTLRKRICDLQNRIRKKVI